MTSEFFEVDKDGIGHQVQYTSPQIQPEDKDKREFHNNIVQAIYKKHGYRPDKDIIVQKPEEHLYLNKKKIILLSKVDPRKKLRLIGSRINRWWHQESTQDLKDLFSFIIIHGFLASFAGVAMLMFSGFDHWMINYIRDNVWLSAVVFILGTGSLYYLMLDINKELFSTWGKANARKR